MGSLGDNSVAAVSTSKNNISPGTAVWVVTFDPTKMPRDQDFEIYHGTAEGPGGIFKMYIDGKFYSAGVNGQVNVYDPNTAALIRKGQTVTVEWNNNSGAGANVRFWFRTPEQTGKTI